MPYAVSVRFASRSISRIVSIEFNCSNSSNNVFLPFVQVPFSTALDLPSQSFFNRSVEGHIFCAFRPVLGSGLQGTWSSSRKFVFFSPPVVPSLHISLANNSIVLSLSSTSSVYHFNVEISKISSFFDKVTISRMCTDVCSSNQTVFIHIPLTQLESGTRYYLRSNCGIESLESAFSRPISFDHGGTPPILFLASYHEDIPKIKELALFFVPLISCSKMNVNFFFQSGIQSHLLSDMVCSNFSTGVKLAIMLPFFHSSVPCFVIATKDGNLLYSAPVFIGNELQNVPVLKEFGKSSSVVQIARSHYFVKMNSNVTIKSVILVPPQATVQFDSVFLGKERLVGTFLPKSSRLYIYTAQLNLSALPRHDTIVFVATLNGIQSNQSEAFTLLPSPLRFLVFPSFIVDDDSFHLVNVSLYNLLERIDRSRLSAVSNYGTFVDLFRIVNVHPFMNMVQLKCRLPRGVPTFDISLIQSSLEIIKFRLNVLPSEPRIVHVSPSMFVGSFHTPVVVHLRGDISPLSVQLVVLQQTISVQNVVFFDAYASSTDVRRSVESKFKGDPDFLAAAYAALEYWKYMDYSSNTFKVLIFESPVVSNIHNLNYTHGAVVPVQLTVSYSNALFTPSYSLDCKIATISCNSSLLEFSGVFYEPGSITTGFGGTADLIVQSLFIRLHVSSFSVYCVSNQKKVEISFISRSSGSFRLRVTIPILLQGHADFELNVTLSAQCTLPFKFSIPITDPHALSVRITSSPLFLSKGPRQFVIAAENIRTDVAEEISLVSDFFSLQPRQIACASPICAQALISFEMPNLASLVGSNFTFIIVHGPRSAAISLKAIPDPITLQILNEVVISDIIGPNLPAVIELRIVGLLTSNSSELSIFFSCT